MGSNTTVLSAPNVSRKPDDFQTEVHNDWCPGCGDFGILRAVQTALVGLGREPHEVAIFSGIGCSGKLPHYVNTYGIHVLHGRVLPYAAGAKLANPRLEVIAVGGDGDGLGIGAGHFVNAGRRNLDIAYLLHNNQVYGLTKGQAAPSMKLGVQTKALPHPNIQGEVNGIWLALASGATFVARAYSFDVKHLVEIIQRAVRHRGYAFVDILQPCPTYDNLSTREWFAGLDRRDAKDAKPKPRVQRIDEAQFDPVVRDPGEAVAKTMQALQLALEWGDRIPVGVFYQNEQVSTFEQRIQARLGNYFDAPPALQVIDDERGYSTADMTALFDQFRVQTA
jgi:2-oxoglutarate ferredoxin oxidoreductase subunit beta